MRLGMRIHLTAIAHGYLPLFVVQVAAFRDQQRSIIFKTFLSVVVRLGLIDPPNERHKVWR